MQLKYKTWTQIDEYLKQKKTIIQPVGSTEQHGPTALIGTDYLCAKALADELGKETKTLVAPPLCFGMAEHHMAFAGTLSLKPSTYTLVIQDLLRSYHQHGFENILFINGHGGNIVPLQQAFCEWKANHDALNIRLENWWRMPEVQKYEQEHFGDENGFHATCGEVALTMFTDASAFESIKSQNFSVDKQEAGRILSASEVRKFYPDGRMNSNPGLSTKEHGKKLFDISIKTLKQRLSDYGMD